METFTSYSITKQLRVKVISSKVQPQHRPRRSRSRTAKSAHRYGKSVTTETKITTEMTTGMKKKTVRFQETRIPDQEQTESQCIPSYRTGKPNSEMRPRRSRIPVSQDSARLETNADRGPSQFTEIRVPRQRAGIHRPGYSNTKPTTKSPGIPVRNEQAGRGAARSHTPVSTIKKESRSIVPVAFQTRPTKERHVSSAAAKERPVQITRQTLPTELTSLNAPLLKFFKEKVSLPQEDISRTSEAVNSLLSTILDKIRLRDATFALKQLNTGSYYEKLRVSRPVEFDVMLVFDAHRIMRFFDEQYSRDHPGYAKLVFRDHVAGGRELWGQFLTRDGKYLSPDKLVGTFYTLVHDAVKSMRAPQGNRVSRLIRNGPAVTLRINDVDVDLVLSVEILKWPRCASGWGDFSTTRTWPTQRDVEEIKMKEPKFHLVAKPFPSENYKCASLDSHLYWRISFSEAEKTLLKSASSDKKFYRITKAICLAKKLELEPLTSFHLKNLFLRNRRNYPREKHDDSNLGESVVRFLQSLIHRFEEGSLPHFFVSRVNLFAEMSRDERTNAALKLRGYLGELVQNPNRFLEGLRL